MVLVQSLYLLAAAQSGSTAVDWRWDRESSGCGLLQAINSRGDIIGLGGTPGNAYTAVTIKDHAGGKIPARTLSGGFVSFGAGESVEADVSVSRDAAGFRSIVASSPDRDAMAKISRASTVEISHPKLGTVKAVVRSAAAAVDAIIKCEDLKMREWGMDPTAWRALKSKPVPLKPLWELLSPYDYPQLAAAYRVEGKVIIRLDVSSDGRVTGCKPLNSLRYKGFEDSVCSVFRKSARFRPATGPDGNAVSAPHVLTVNFVLR